MKRRLRCDLKEHRKTLGDSFESRAKKLATRCTEPVRLRCDFVSTERPWVIVLSLGRKN